MPPADVRRIFTRLELISTSCVSDSPRDIDLQALDTDADAEALAGMPMAVMQGMSTVACDGTLRDKLLRIAQSR